MPKKAESAFMKPLQPSPALAKVTDAELRAVLERLRDEEAFHADYLQDNWARLAAKLSRS